MKKKRRDLRFYSYKKKRRDLRFYSAKRYFKKLSHKIGVLREENLVNCELNYIKEEGF